MSEDERWLPIPGFVGYYEVSDLGRVKSLARIVKRGSNQITIRGKILKGTAHPFGYRSYTLRGADGKNQTVLGHVLVLLAFVGPKPEGMEIRHLDGIAERSVLENLQYGTHTENMQDMKDHGHHFQLNKTHCPEGHPFSEANTYRYPDGRRGCRICLEAKSRKWREENHDRKLAMDRAYHAAHREENNAKRAQYDIDHRERQKAYNKAYREANLEKLRAQSRAAHEAHKEERNAARRQWTKDHAEHSREYHRAYGQAHKKPE